MTPPTYSQVVSTLALFAALGGTGYAAATISSADVRDGSLTGRDGRNSSLTGADVRNRSLRAADFARGALPAGPAGPGGVAGAPGPAGPPGAQGPRGERGPSEAIEFETASTQLGLGEVVVGRLEVEAGSWVVAMNGSFSAPGTVNRLAGCSLFARSALVARARSVRVAGGAGMSPIALTGAATLTQAGGLELVCLCPERGAQPTRRTWPSRTFRSPPYASRCSTTARVRRRVSRPRPRPRGQAA